MNIKRGLLAAGAVTVALAMTGCSMSAQPDEVGLHYKGGSFTSTSFNECVDPGNRTITGPGDKEFLYPAGQRTYTFDDVETAESGALTMVSSDNLRMVATGIVTFQLNTDCEDLRDFHESIGLKYEAYTDAGWNDFMRDYMLQPLDRAVDAAAKEYTWQEMFNNAEVKEEWEERVGELTTQYMGELGGSSYICSPTHDFTEETEEEGCGSPVLTFQQPQIPEETAEALERTINAQENANAQEEVNRAIELEAEGLDPLIDQFDGDMQALILYLALQDGEIDFMPLPDGSGVITDPSD